MEKQAFERKNCQCRQRQPRTWFSTSCKMALILITGFCLLSIVYSTVIDFVPSYRLFGPTIRNIELGESPIVLPKLTKSVDFTKVLRTLYGQLLQPVSSKTFNANDLKVYALDKSAFWNSSLGDSICIVDIDSAKLGGVNHHGSGWRDRQRVTAGMLNHYAFGMLSDPPFGVNNLLIPCSTHTQLFLLHDTCSKHQKWYAELECDLNGAVHIAHGSMPFQCFSGPRLGLHKPGSTFGMASQSLAYKRQNISRNHRSG